MKVEVDAANCIGSGQCVLAAPEVFDQNEDDGVVVLLNDAPPAEQSGPVREAATVCPASVIRILG